MASRRVAKSQKPLPSTAGGRRVKEKSGSSRQGPYLTEIPPMKRQRTHRVIARNPHPAPLQTFRGFANDLFDFNSQGETAAGFQDMLASHAGFLPLSGMRTYMSPHDEVTTVPRVASSAHINELVAKYSHPYAEQELWSPRERLTAPHLQATFAYHPRSGPANVVEAKSLDPTPEVLCSRNLNREPQASLQVPGHPSRDNRALLKAGAAAPPDCIPEAGIAPVGSGGTFFEDLAIMAANADIEDQELASLAGSKSGEGGNGDPPLVEGLLVEEDTKQAVEKWLRDFPETGHMDCLPEGLAAEEEERSLPQWVLDELGENDAEAKECEQVQSLVRADSHGSSTNMPTFSLKGETWEEDKGGCGIFPSGSPAVTGDLTGMPVQKSLRLKEAELSVQSCPGEQDLLEDDAQSRSNCSQTNAIAQMNRSFSTTWMKDLLEDGDMFKDELGAFNLIAPSPHTGSIPIDDAVPAVLSPGWADEQFLPL